ncbi:MAG: YggS family pyridoxal phosphate-dependent enzyme [Candidatus Saccharibacteria bacterium]
MSDIAANIASIRQRIERAAASARSNPENITLVAVSKTVNEQAVTVAYKNGVRDFGENRVQELVGKERIVPQARWHLIGRLQTNKVKEVLGKAFLIHSLDRWALAEYIEKRATNMGINVPVLLQVNVAGEDSKAGVTVPEALSFLDSLGQLPHIMVRGLMTIAPEVDDPEEVRPVFRELRRLFEVISKQSYTNVDMKYLSMGMTQDFEVAIEEGANIIRVGRALFGPR